MSLLFMLTLSKEGECVFVGFAFVYGMMEMVSLCVSARKVVCNLSNLILIL